MQPWQRTPSQNARRHLCHLHDDVPLSRARLTDGVAGHHALLMGVRSCQYGASSACLL